MAYLLWARQNVRVARRKKPATTGDLIRTLVVILVPLLIVTALFTRNLKDYPVKEVEWQPTLALARDQAAFPILAPVGLPDSWRPTQVTWVKKGQPHLSEPSPRNLWQLGYLDPHDIFISVNQADDRSELFVADLTRGGETDGSSEIGGVKWTRYVTPDGRTRSLVLITPKVTAAVVGDTSYEALEAFAGTLQP